MVFLKLLKIFILSTIFNDEDEYNPKSIKFNVVKVVVFLILVGSLIFNVYILYRLTIVYDMIDKQCHDLTTTL